MPTARTPVLAIDFGTANSVAVLFDGHDFDKVTDPNGRFIMPSSVFYTADDQWLVGWDATQMGMADPDRYKAGLKRELEITGTLPLGDQHFARIELIGQVLSFLRQQAEQRTGETIHQAVLTVPAAYDEYRRELMVDAARIAGFSARITTEPEAAAFSEGALIGEDPVLVYDLGAGTFDTAVVRRTDGGFEVIGHAGLPHCGGLDVDRLVYNHLRSLAHNPSQQAVLNGSDNSTQARARRLQFNDECRQKKELLSAVAQVTGNSLVLDPPLAYTITRDWLEAAQTPMLLDTIKCCRQLLDDCGLATSALGHILLIGGSTHAPVVSRLLQTELHCDIRSARVPETAVAEGASRWGWHTQTTTTQNPGGNTSLVESIAVPGGLTTLAVAPGTSAGTPIAVSGGVDGMLRVWHLRDGTPGPVIAAHDGVVSTIDVSADGTAVASGGRNGIVHWWSPATGATQKVFAHSSWVNTVRISPDGGHILSVADDGHWRYGAVGTASRSGRTASPVPGRAAAAGTAVEGHLSGSRATAGAMSPATPGLCAIADSVGLIRFTTRSQVSVGPAGGAVSALALAAANRLAAGYANGVVRVWQLPQTRPFAQSPVEHADGSAVRDLRFGPTSVLASGHSDGTVRVWNPDMPGRPETVGSHNGEIRAVAFPAEELVVSAGADGFIRLWHTQALRTRAGRNRPEPVRLEQSPVAPQPGQEGGLP